MVTSNIMESHLYTTVDDINITELTELTERLPVPPDIYGVKNETMMLLTYLISALGIPGNVLTMLVLLSSKSLRSKPINIFLIHQTSIDLLSCVVTIFEEIITDMESMVKPVVCHMFLSKISGGILFYASTYNMVFLSIERYQAIMNPLGYDSEKVLRRLPGVFLLVWVICIAALCIM